MSNKRKLVAVCLSLMLAVLLPLVPGCVPAEPADSYAAVVPAVLQVGVPQAVSLTLFKDNKPISGRVSLALLQNGKEVLTVNDNVQGNDRIQFTLPAALPVGDYTLRLSGDTFTDEAKVKLENKFLVFVETDKPIYKPGQTIQMRLITLNPDLLPLAETATIEVLDAKGIKIFRRELTTDAYGMASLELPLSTEPNLGVWKITATTPASKSQLDVRVEEYVLPKYEVKVELPKQWFLVSEAIKGKVTAEYSFGKPVQGNLEIIASRYVGQWQVYNRYSTIIDGSGEFTIPAAGYVAGVPAAGGQGNVRLDVTVTEKSTGYEAETSQLLTVAQAAVNVSIIPAGVIFKPSLPYSFLVVTKAPDSTLVEDKVAVQISYYNQDFKSIGQEQKNLTTTKGKALVQITPPSAATAMVINVNATNSSASKTIEAGYSPSGNFIHLEQLSEGTPSVGQEMKFRVYATQEASNFYYEVISRGKVVFSDFTKNRDFGFLLTPQMAPSAKLLVYQILPNSEVAADYLPFDVTASYPQNVTVNFSQPEAKPGDNININIQTEGPARVGIAAVDKSVFILAENRMNLQQVFDKLEELYMQPQAELHEVSLIEGITTRGAKEIFQDAGVIVLSNRQVPAGKEFKQPNAIREFLPGLPFLGGAKAVAPVPAAQAPAPPAAADQNLAEVQRVRQFFPETWLWQTVTTDSDGRAVVKAVVPDTITTWMLRAVALSKSKGLGVAETQLKAFQPFFLSVDLPYSAIRGEEFPVKVAVYNYLGQTQDVVVQIQAEDWFDLLDKSQQTISIKPNDIGGVAFTIRPKLLGTNGVKITARSAQAADAVVKTLIIEPEGVSREMVDNLTLSAGTRTLDTTIPPLAVAGSGRSFFAVTASYLAQTIDGLETLLQMPFGCGEQNMIVLAPDVYISKYLRESGQLKPEIMAKAEKLMITGYQRELTYRRSDGSFSAFGQTDAQGSLWLTAFVLKTFAQAKDIIFIDDSVLAGAKTWITAHQNRDGSFDLVGFVHHQEMMGGLQGKTALTAYVAAALLQAGETTGSAKAIAYLEGQIDSTSDAYAMALISYALELAKSPRAATAVQKLMGMAKEDEKGLHWGEEILPLPVASSPAPGIIRGPMPPSRPNRTASIETTAYAAMALMLAKDNLNAGRAAKWLVSQRNAYGGYGSTQDTVVALEALTQYATGSRADVDLTITLAAGGKTIKELKLTPVNYDVLQIVELPNDQTVTVNVNGKGEAVGQLVTRYNLPDADPVTSQDILKIDVAYDVTTVAVNDLLTVSATVSFNPPQPMEAGMVVVDVSVPTGFAPVKESIEKAVAQNKLFKRYDIAGRKVIFYLENLYPGDKVSFSFNAVALYPVKAKGVTSTVYSYYKPEISAETLGKDVTVK